MGNGNHPQMGSQIKVEPIKRIKDIKLIKKMLADRPRDLALFTVGINTNLRASDLLALRVGQVAGASDEALIREQKTGKERRLTLNRLCREAITAYLDTREWHPDEPLFMGQRGPLIVSTLSRMVKAWCKAINLKGNYASHTLRKTWGYHQRVTFGVDLPRLTLCFNHSSQKQTLDYLCIQPEEIQEVFDNEL